MESFLSGLGTKIADKWLTTVALPGLLFVGFTLLAWTKGTTISSVVARADAASTALRRAGAAAIVLDVAAILLLSSAAALTAHGLGFLIQRGWLGQWPAPFAFLASRLTASRRRRWTDADEATAEQLALDREVTDNVNSLAAARNNIALSYPACPTWIGDRAHSVDVRAWHAYRLDLGTAWPRLWLVLEETARNEIIAARDAFQRGGTLAGWAILYLALAFCWWPLKIFSALSGTIAILVGAATAVTAWYRARAAIASYADLTEAAVDLNARQLAVNLGVLCETDKFTPETGLQIMRLIRKGT